jgi:hypothetical protein
MATGTSSTSRGRPSCAPTRAHPGDRIDYDQRTRIVTAAGHCYAVNGLAGAVADGLTLDLDGNWLQLQNGRLFVKADVAPEVLLQTSTPEQLVATGRTTLAARVERAERVGQGHLKINGLDFTPCDCNPLEPTGASRPSRRTSIRGTRRGSGSGHLRLRRAHPPASGARRAAQAAEDGPPGDDAVPQRAERVAGDAAGVLRARLELGPHGLARLHLGVIGGALGRVQTLGVKGPSLDTEVRWAHSRDTKGDIELFLLDDLRTLRDPRSLGSTRDAHHTRWLIRRARREARIPRKSERRGASELR